MRLTSKTLFMFDGLAGTFYARNLRERNPERILAGVTEIYETERLHGLSKLRLSNKQLKNLRRYLASCIEERARFDKKCGFSWAQ